MTPPAPVEFAFADPARRTWLALSQAGGYYHVIHPVDPEDMRVRDGLRRIGELTCECAGGRFRGTCYVVAAAEARERAAAAEATWFDGPPGEIAEAFGK